MALREKPTLTPEEIKRVAAAATKVGDFDTEISLAEFDPENPPRVIDRPINLAARNLGKVALLKNALNRNDLRAFSDYAKLIAKSVLGKEIPTGGIDERLITRAVLKAIEEVERNSADAHLDMAGLEGPDPEILQLEYDPNIEFEELLGLSPAERAKLLDDIEKRILPQGQGKQTPPGDAVLASAPTLSSTSTPQSSELPNENKTFSELWERFVKYQDTVENWQNDETIAVRATFKLWVQLEGDLPPKSYSNDNMENFIEQLKLLPAKYYHNREFKAIYLQKGIRALNAHTARLDCKRTTKKTRNKHVSRLNQFFLWCAGIGKALPKDTPSICEGFYSRTTKVKIGMRIEQDRRRIYEPDEIKVLLSAPCIMGWESERSWKNKGDLVFRNHRYWVFLLALLHGMRLGEPVLLKVKHVRCVDKIWYFDLLDQELAPLLKGIGSPREIPLHKDLIAIGFLEARFHGRNPEDRLFPEAVSHGQVGGDGGPIGKWFLQFRRSLRVDDPNLNFHAFRHTAVTGLNNAGVPTSHIEEIVGHEDGERREVFHIYNHGVKLKTLRTGINKFKIPIDVEAIKAAVARSDAINPKAAWPDLSDPNIIPKPREMAKKLPAD